jgi:hypothetical protein
MKTYQIAKVSVSSLNGGMINSVSICIVKADDTIQAPTTLSHKRDRERKIL